MNSLLKNINRIFTIFFTPFPYYLYNISTKHSNFAYSGVGLGLINLQKIFYISNLGLFFFIYYYNSINFYIQIILCNLFIYIYVSIILKTFYLVKFLENIVIS